MRVRRVVRGFVVVGLLVGAVPRASADGGVDGRPEAGTPVPSRTPATDVHDPAREAPSPIPVVRVPEAPQGSIRERGARRRGANPAGGVFLVVSLIGLMAYYVVKKLRR
ncbi:MAG: hypothetical protein U0169_06480 [Polyangiaceae bacterium]